MKFYLVTGAAGFVGAAITKRLVEDGHQVVTIDNLSTGFESNIPDGVEFILGDCGDAKVYSQLQEVQFDAIFHINLF